MFITVTAATKINKKYILYIALAISLIAIAVVPSFYFYSQYQNAQKLLGSTKISTEEENSKLIETIGKLIELPKNELPQIATVTDKNKLQNQQFFLKAENGDKVLVYSQSKKIILYRPSINKIIDVAPVNLGQIQETEQASPTATLTPKQEKIKFALYNGTKTVGITDKAESRILGKIDNYELAVQLKADKSDYDTTFVADLSGKNEQVAKEVATILGGRVVAKSQVSNQQGYKDADILVIVGNDFK